MIKKAPALSDALRATLHSPAWNRPIHEEFSRLLSKSKKQRVRTMREFAESEITIPTGNYAGRKYRCSRQPFTGLLFDEIDSGRWSEFRFTGPSQSTKSLSFFIIPILYGLFELEEDVIVGVPTLKPMAHKKWDTDILPVIEASRYASLLPTSGPGSQGNKEVQEIQFAHGPRLLFMSAAGNDKARAAFTARILVFTEIDEMARISSTSTEGSPITQIEARAEHYDVKDRLIFKECTTTTSDGYIWSSIVDTGSASRIAMKCPHCKKYSTPEEEHLQGWQDAKSDREAGKLAYFICPCCSKPWSEADRRKANRDAKIIHGSFDHYAKLSDPETYAPGTIKDDPNTDTLIFGCRFSPPNNLLKEVASFGISQYRLSKSTDRLSADRSRDQFMWARPNRPPALEELNLGLIDLRLSEVNKYRRGLVPPHTDYISIGLDIGKYRNHWVAMAASLSERKIIIFDYGKIELVYYPDPSDKTEYQKANQVGFPTVFHQSMDRWFARMMQGWPVAGQDASLVRTPNIFLADGRWQDKNRDSREEPVTSWVRTIQQDPKLPNAYLCYGYASTHYFQRRFSKPKRTTTSRRVGHEYFIEFDYPRKCHVVHSNSDAWKTIIQSGLTKIPTAQDAIILPNATSENEHEEFLKHIKSERMTRYFDHELGKHIIKFVAEHEYNHYLDSSALAHVGLHKLGFRSDADLKKLPSPKAQPQDTDRSHRNRTGTRLPATGERRRRKPSSSPSRRVAFLKQRRAASNLKRR